MTSKPLTLRNPTSLDTKPVAPQLKAVAACIASGVLKLYSARKRAPRSAMRRVGATHIKVRKSGEQCVEFVDAIDIGKPIGLYE